MSTKEKHNLIRESFRVKRHTYLSCIVNYGTLLMFLGYLLMLETKYMNRKWKTLPEFHINDI